MKMFFYNYKTLTCFFIAFSFFLISCINKKTYYRSFSELYVFPDKNKVDFSVRITHEDDKSSTIFYNLNSCQLKYKKTDFDSLFTAAFKISYRLPSASGNKKAGDTSFFVLFDHVKIISEHQVFGKVKIKISKGFYGFLDVSLMDLNSGKRGYEAVFVDKKNIYSAQNYFLENLNHKYQVQSPFNIGDSILLFNNRFKQTKNLFVDYFVFSPDPALPPFTNQLNINLIKPLLQFNLADLKGKFNLTLESKGLYFCRIDTAIKSGLSLLATSKEFPNYNSTNDKIGTLRYILTSQEFEALKSSENSKDVLVSVWKNFSGSDKRANELMNEWYKRVSLANTFFTSYKEGWKTDRGMIFLVFGHPRTIEKTNENEIWFYGDLNSLNCFQFEFEKNKNPLTENDYVLQRNSALKNKWYAAVDVWRKGRIYSAY